MENTLKNSLKELLSAKRPVDEILQLSERPFGYNDGYEPPNLRNGSNAAQKAWQRYQSWRNKHLAACDDANEAFGLGLDGSLTDEDVKLVSRRARRIRLGALIFEEKFEQVYRYPARTD